MKITSQAISHGQHIHPRYAFGKRDPNTNNIALSENLNPDLTWTDAPAATKSFVIICVDQDVPSVADDVNKPNCEIPADLPRVDFYHWVLIDIPATVTHIAQGDHSNSITPKGKPGPDHINGTRHGLNNYTDWFADDQDMAGDYFGYDGPCPPFNDSIVHRYSFTVYAIDIERVPVEGKFTALEVIEAIKPHILDKATITSLYSTNPKLAKH